jgi:hypothetical protein
MGSFMKEGLAKEFGTYRKAFYRVDKSIKLKPGDVSAFESAYNGEEEENDGTEGENDEE